MLDFFKTLFGSTFALLFEGFVTWPWWARGVLGAALGAALLVGIPAVVNWTKDRLNEAKLRVDCRNDLLPALIPAEGQVEVVQLMAPGVGGPPQAGQIATRYGDPGTPTGWQGVHAYRCEVRNLGKSVLYDVGLTLVVEFNEAVRGNSQPVVSHAGAAVRGGQVSIVAERLEPQSPFIFYVRNESAFYAAVATISAGPERPDQNLPRLIVDYNPMRRMTFGPPL
jgi:hypothetical protein